MVLTGLPRDLLLSRRRLLTSLPAAIVASPALADSPRVVTVYRTAACGCCRGWITHMVRAGFQPKDVVVEDVGPVWRRYGVPDQLSSCHVAEIGGYVFVGHVPPADVRRLLNERPVAIGLAVPGMPLGSPGMEQPDGRREPFETLLLTKGARPRVFARHS